MAKVIPFKAVRPTRDKVSLVASRSYQSYTQSELEARLNYNPFSFLQIVNPGYRYNKNISGQERYNLVNNRYLEFKEEGVFVQDKKIMKKISLKNMKTPLYTVRTYLKII